MLDAVGHAGDTLTHNRLLQLIPAAERARLLDLAEQVPLKPRQVLHHWRLPMEHVYFIEHGLVSVSARVDKDRFVEVWLIGSEGMVGAPLVLVDEDQTPPHRRVVQVGGSALRIRSQDFLQLLPELPVLRKVLLRYINVVLLQTSQSGTCNAVHSLKERLARWLLTASSALEAADLPLTHEVLSHLLGVRRASVTECLDVLEKHGMIRNSRGMISIADADKLAESCCGCFRLIERAYRKHLQER